jgi:hypothetical protein
MARANRSKRTSKHLSFTLMQPEGKQISLLATAIKGLYYE